MSVGEGDTVASIAAFALQDEKAGRAPRSENGSGHLEALLNETIPLKLDVSDDAGTAAPEGEDEPRTDGDGQE